ncbi:metallophosphoesterase family protein [Paracidovorax oryzae]|uniref:metallophosphoesterase family protein n=1 Tax=Paracidovorax oryzae TaxID=862720 RepID=UPI000A003B65|nr:metallophosphoesterase [Paracidovorax oryzae]
MSNKITWLHLSDFHFSTLQGDQIRSSQDIIRHLCAVKERIRPDYVFVTGDIAKEGRREEYLLYIENIVNPIISLYGEEFREKIIAVPGNHDLDRNINDAFSKEKLVRPDLNYFGVSERSLASRKIVVDRFTNFITHSQCAVTADFSQAKGYFLKQQKYDFGTVAIIGLNTAWLSDGDKDFGALTPGFQLTKAALAEAKNAEIKIVLGHHPIEWFHSSQQNALKSIFAENKIIYLHGHMHKENGTTHITGSGEFLSIQSGAAWQAPESSKWINGFIWSTLDLVTNQVRIQPYTWNFDQQCWILNGTNFHENNRQGDWWVFSAPTGKKKIDYTAKKKIELPPGWEVKDLRALEKFTEKLSDSDAVTYFDGATPTWKIALSDSIPRREIVGKITDIFKGEANTTTVCTLLAAGCEGKTTALLQATLEVLRNDKTKRVLFRTNHTSPFVAEELIETLKNHKKWLVVIDEADQLAIVIHRFIESGCKDLDIRIDFLLASRDSDWRASGASELAWDFRAKHKEVVLKDLNPRDAELIVNAWEKYGDKGLGELSRTNITERAAKLRYFARKEAQGTSGAFFGALLLSRHGGELLEHAESMLQKLSKIPLEDGKSLKDVLGYIAAMHAEGFEKLTFAALAALLKIPVSKLQNEIIRQLGKEAAATSTASAIFTRHRYIAEAIIEVLHSKFNEDIAHYYIDLALSESERSNREHVISLPFWRYEMPERLMANGKTGLAIEIATQLYEADPTNVRLLTKLAFFYRKTGNTGDAAALFRNSDHILNERGFFFEWSVCEGTERKHQDSALLSAYALSDECEPISPTIEQACMYLSGLSTNSDQLHIAFADRVFYEAQSAVYSLLELLYRVPSSQRKNDPRVQDFARDVEKRRRTRYNKGAALSLINEMVMLAQKYGYSSTVANAIKHKNFTFGHLERLLANAERMGD